MNEEEGFVKLNRKIMKWGWYDDLIVSRLFIHLILTANYKDNEWHGIVIKRGQVVTGRKKLSEETGITEQQVRTALDKLISSQEITIKATNKYSVITINNYNKYQDINQQITNNQPTNNQQITTNKKEKKEKNNKKKKEKDFLLPLISESDFYKDKEHLKQKVIEWLNYKNERKEHYKGIGFKSLLTQIQKNVEIYNEEAVINLIDECMANNWKGIIWDKLKENTKEKRNPYAGVKQL